MRVRVQQKSTGVRQNIRVLEQWYDTGNTKPLDDVIRAFRGVQQLTPFLQFQAADAPIPTADNSYFTIAGFHGEPFRGAGAYNKSEYWGGYCAHGNVLFPVWHRAYLWRFEKALQSIPGCQDVMMPFWDQTEQESMRNGIPKTFLKPKWTLDGVEIDNPLYSYKFQMPVSDSAGDDASAGWNYSKCLGYETKRYPYSGLDGPSNKAVAQEHNAIIDEIYDTPDKINAILNDNITTWLNSPDYRNHKGELKPAGTAHKYAACLEAPNYTVFSNTTSAKQWNSDMHVAPSNRPPRDIVETLEAPHNDIHLAVGGFENAAYKRDFNLIAGANGDMGENDTAAFDPIFFFHHCWIDRVFWLWQQKHNATRKLEVMVGYPGTNSVDEQGPTPGMAPNIWLDMDTPLDPFHFPTQDGKRIGRSITGNDVANIANLGYDYGNGSLPTLLASSVPCNDFVATAYDHGASLEISGISRGAISGSFVINTYIKRDGQRELIDVHSVLSRWQVAKCSNCQKHLGVRYFVPLNRLPKEQIESAEFETELVMRSVGNCHRRLSDPCSKGLKTKVRWQSRAA